MPFSTLLPCMDPLSDTTHCQIRDVHDVKPPRPLRSNRPARGRLRASGAAAYAIVPGGVPIPVLSPAPWPEPTLAVAMARAELAQRCPRPLFRAMAGAELARHAMAGNFLAQHTVAAVQSEKLSESDVDRAKAERRRSPAAASVNSRRRRGPARRTTRLGHALEHLPAASCGWSPSARSGTVVQVPVQRRLGELVARNAGAAQHQQQ